MSDQVIAVPRNDFERSLAAWLLGPGRACADAQTFLREWCEAMVALGLPVDRILLTTQTLHPQVWGIGFRWSRATGVGEFFAVPHRDLRSLAMRANPVSLIGNSGRTLRFRLTSDCGGFAELADLRDQGFTDYYGQPLSLFGGRSGVVTYATQSPGGFTDEHLSAIEAMLPLVEIITEARIAREVSATILRTYLGADAGARVGRGQIKRGDAETIRAAIWMSDLRDFTGLSDRLSREALVSLLNDAFEAQVGAINANGGQVLKFIGDGLLAIFPVEGRTEAAACEGALKAADDVRGRIAELNKRRAAGSEPPIDFGLALHLGEVFYGNIGSPERLDFTVIGPAVNRAARLEALCKPLGRDVVASAEFALACGRALDPLGKHSLKGVEGTHPVFGA